MEAYLNRSKGVEGEQGQQQRRELPGDHGECGKGELGWMQRRGERGWKSE